MSGSRRSSLSGSHLPNQTTPAERECQAVAEYIQGAREGMLGWHAAQIETAMNRVYDGEMVDWAEPSMTRPRPRRMGQAFSKREAVEPDPLVPQLAEELVATFSEGLFTYRVRSSHLTKELSFGNRDSPKTVTVEGNK